VDESGTVAVKPSSKEENQNYLKFHGNVSSIYLAMRVTWYIVKISFNFCYHFYFILLLSRVHFLFLLPGQN